MKTKRGIESLGALKGKRVLLRVDFNVPLQGEDGGREVADDYRLQMALPTIRTLKGRGARLVLCSHLGRPKGRYDAALSLAPVAKALGELLEEEVRFCPVTVGPEALKASQALADGQVLLLENLRFDGREKKGDAEFAEALAELGDVYVNDAFGVCHRAHASVAGIPPLLPSAMGELIERELQELQPLRDGDVPRPFVVVLGGAKLKDKIPVLDSLVAKVDAILIGGGMAYTFLKGMGKQIGGSRFDEATVDAALEIMEKARGRFRETGQALILPRDHVVATAPDDLTGYAVVDDEIPDGLMGLDIGPHTIAEFVKVLATAKTVFWNGPLGVFEKQPLHLGTHYVASFLAHRKGETRVIVGGGDSAAATRAMGLAEHMHWVSTGGGASLQFVQGEDLPGLDALPDA